MFKIKYNLFLEWSSPNVLSCEISWTLWYVRQCLALNASPRGDSSSALLRLSTHDQTDLEPVSVEYSASRLLVQKWNVTSREFLPLAANTRIPGLRTTPFTFYSRRRIRVRNLGPGGQNPMNAAPFLTLLLRFLCGLHARLQSATSSSHQLLFNPCPHARDMDCVPAERPHRSFKMAQIDKQLKASSWL